MAKTPDRPKTPESDEEEILRPSFATTPSEPEIEVEEGQDLMDSDDAELLRKGALLRDTMEAAFLGIGVMSHAHEFLEANPIPAISESGTYSYLARLAVSGVAVGGFSLATQYLRDYSDGRSWMSFVKIEPKKAAILAGFGALGVFVLADGMYQTVFGNFKDAMFNSFLVEDLDRMSTEMAQQDPHTLPVVATLTASLHEDIINSLGDEGQLTALAMAKMTLYFDGQSVQLNANLDENTEPLKEWTVEKGEVTWSIKEISAEDWIVKGDHSGWRMGHGSIENNVKTTFDENFESDGAYLRLIQILEASEKIDGKTIIDDAIAHANFQDSTDINLYEGLGKLFTFAPYEWNTHWRNQTLTNAGDTYDEWIAANGEILRTVLDTQLKDPDAAYAQTIEAIEQTIPK